MTPRRLLGILLIVGSNILVYGGGLYYMVNMRGTWNAWIAIVIPSALLGLILLGAYFVDTGNKNIF